MENKKEELKTEELIELLVEDQIEDDKSAKETEDKPVRIEKKSAQVFNIVRVFVLIIAAGVLIFSSYSLTESYLNYKEDEKKYAEINEMFVQEAEVSKDTAMSYSSNSDEWVWDYEAMLEYNEEAKGYIKLDGTRIQYPIVEHTDNDFYLYRGTDKISNGSGSIFVDYRTAGLEGGMCILYGHNMRDGSMFKDLTKFKEPEFCEDNQVFDVYIGYKHYKYYVFSTFSAKDIDSSVYQFGFTDDSDFQAWINRVYSKSTYDFDYGKPDVNDKIIMCSTCLNKGVRRIVCMYRGEEVVK